MELTPSLLPQTVPRVLGTYGGQSEGPLMLCLGGIHGNEPAGVVAAQRVIDLLRSRHPPLRGELIALTGNRAALLRRCRYLEQDLNRVWFADRIAAFQKGTWETPLGPDVPSFKEW
jgi:succinylglutamate desuccinylase